MTIKLRPYQERCLDSTLRYFANGGSKPFIHLFTGGGKAYLGLLVGLEVGGFLTEETPKRVAFLAHTRELTDQPYYSLFKLAPHLKNKYFGRTLAAGIVRAGRNNADARYLFATMQTLAGDEGKRLDEVLSHGAFDLVIVDEAHHSAAKSYADTILPKMLEANPAMKVLGMSATPARSDGKALDGIYDDIVFSMSLLDGMNGGWLRSLNARSVKTEVSLGDVARYQGDFQETALRNALRVQNWTEIVGQAYFDNDGPSRCAIAFMPSVEMGRDLGQYFRDNGVLAASVDHKMVIDGEGTVYEGNGSYWSARDRVLDEFRQSELQVLIGYSVLLEGFDARNADMILQGRPTESEVLLTQLIGRGVRLPGGVARLLQDREKEKYVVQREGQDDKWFEYDYNKVPFNPDCLVLDFTMKDTAVLLSGSLAGNKSIEIPDISEIDQEKELLELIEVEPLPSEFDHKLKEGKGIIYAKRNFFRLSSDNWTMGEAGEMSVYLGCVGEGKERQGSALFIYPRQKTMVGRMNGLLDILDRSQEMGIEIEDKQLYKLMHVVQLYREAFSAFNLFKLTEVPVNVREKNGYTSEFIRWDSHRIVVSPVGRYADLNAAWEAALPISQELSVGGFFVDKKRPGARNKKTTAQLDLMYNPTFKNGSPNLFYTLPETVNAALGAIPNLELFRIEKPLRKSLVDDTLLTSVQMSGMLNHIGIYSAVMLHGLAMQLINAQRLYNEWTALWESHCQS